MTTSQKFPSLIVEPVIVGVGHDNVVLSVDSHPAGLGELALQDPELAKLAVVDHLLPFDLALGRVEGRGGAGERRGGQIGAGHKLGGQVDHITGRLGHRQPVLIEKKMSVNYKMNTSSIALGKTVCKQFITFKWGENNLLKGIKCFSVYTHNIPRNRCAIPY